MSDMIDKAYAYVDSLEVEICDTNKRIIEDLVSKYGKVVLDDYQAICDNVCDFFCYEPVSLEDAPLGDQQSSDVEEYGFKFFKDVYVNQYGNGGITGDSFQGDFYVKIEEDLWLKVPYKC